MLLLLSFLSFNLLRWMPGDFAEVLLIEQMGGEMPDAETLSVFKEVQGFNQPLLIQYVHWLKGLLQGNLGISLLTGDRVWNEISFRFVNSMVLGSISLLISLLVAFPLGILTAIRQGSWLDRGGMVFAVLGMSMPGFWFSLLLILLFSIRLGVLPVAGYSGWQHLCLPAIAVGFSLTGVSSRFIRSCLLDVLGSDYVRTARAKGVSERRVILAHALRNALNPIVTLLGIQTGRLFNSIVVVETVFAWPGLGRLLVESILGRDFPVIQGCVLLVGIVYIAVNLLVDTLVMIVDPTVEGAV